MTVRQLISELQKYDGDILVGGSGHYGEYLEINSVSLEKREGQFSVKVAGGGGGYFRLILRGNDFPINTIETPLPPFVSISIEYAGVEPD